MITSWVNGWTCVIVNGGALKVHFRELDVEVLSERLHYEGVNLDFFSDLKVLSLFVPMHADRLKIDVVLLKMELQVSLAVKVEIARSVV